MALPRHYGPADVNVATFGPNNRQRERETNPILESEAAEITKAEISGKAIELIGESICVSRITNLGGFLILNVAVSGFGADHLGTAHPPLYELLESQLRRAMLHANSGERRQMVYRFWLHWCERERERGRDY